MTERELDVRVAQEVMGWTRREFWPVSDAREDRSKPCVSWTNAIGEYAAYGIPRYSTDVAEAWKVVEKLNDAGWRLSLAHEGGFSDQWVASFMRYEDATSEEFTGEALAPTAPEAICLASLSVPGARR